MVKETEMVIEMLQRRGKRVTNQRRILIDIILKENWSCCKELYYRALKTDSSIGMATVYRTVAMLEEIGVLERGCRYVMTEGSTERNEVDERWQRQFCSSF